MEEVYVKKNKISTKVVVVSIICMSIVVSIWFVSRSKHADSLQNSISDSGVLTVPRETTDEIDSDNDGLFDWQEVLIGTNSSNQDTDGDGAKDGAEVNDGRDPRVKGPNDRNTNLSTIVGGNNSVDTTNVDEGTLTDQMSKDFLAQYLQLKQGGKDITPEQAAQIAQNTIKMSDSIQVKDFVYTAKDLRIVSGTSKELVDAYAKSIKQILVNRAIEDQGTTLDIVSRAVKTKSESELKKLNPIILSYKGVIKDLVELPIPSDAVAVHLNFLNSYSNLLTSVESIRVLFTDPVRSFNALSSYQKQSEEVVASVEKLSLYFKSK